MKQNTIFIIQLISNILITYLILSQISTAIYIRIPLGFLIIIGLYQIEDWIILYRKRTTPKKQRKKTSFSNSFWNQHEE